MSRKKQPKQIIPFVKGKSLLEIAYKRLEGLIDEDRRYVCAGEVHREPILNALDGLRNGLFLGEPEGRDTLAALAYSAAVIGKKDPEAVIAVFTADHIITPEDKFRDIIDIGFRIVEEHPNTLLTFGITPDSAATGFGYLQLGVPFDSGSRIVDTFKEKPDLETARRYVAAGPEKYLWNSGMFVWKAVTFLDCVKRFEPELYEGVSMIAGAWESETFQEVIGKIYPGLKKISVDYAVMEPASAASFVTVAALPMPLNWKDIGSWSAYAGILEADSGGNAAGGDTTIFLECKNSLFVSDEPVHLIAGIGVEDLIVVHTENATLVCRKDKAEEIKKLQSLISEKLGNTYI